MIYLNTATVNDINNIIQESEKNKIPLCLRDKQNKLLFVSHSFEKIINAETVKITPNGTKKEKIYRTDIVMTPTTPLPGEDLSSTNYCYPKIIYDVQFGLYSFDEYNKFKENELYWSKKIKKKDLLIKNKEL